MNDPTKYDAAAEARVEDFVADALADARRLRDLRAWISEQLAELHFCNVTICHAGCADDLRKLAEGFEVLPEAQVIANTERAAWDWERTL